MGGLLNGIDVARTHVRFGFTEDSGVKNRVAVSDAGGMFGFKNVKQPALFMPGAKTPQPNSVDGRVFTENSNTEFTAWGGGNDIVLGDYKGVTFSDHETGEAVRLSSEDLAAFDFNEDGKIDSSEYAGLFGALRTTHQNKEGQAYLETELNDRSIQGFSSRSLEQNVELAKMYQGLYNDAVEQKRFGIYKS